MTRQLRLYMFEGHESPVYSVCPHHKENIYLGTLFAYCFLFPSLLESFVKLQKFHRCCLAYCIRKVYVLFYLYFIFSTAIDGKIKAWLYDSLGSRVDYDAPTLWCTTMAYSADGTRLFSCGTSKNGESHRVE